jgi:competence protein ComEC
MLGIGICFYFLLKSEPSRMIHICAISLAVLCAALVPMTGRRLPWTWRAPILGVCALAAGFALAEFRAQSVAAPVLEVRYYGPVEGRIIAIDRSASAALRLTLDQVHLGRPAPWKTPDKVRISLHGDQRWLDPKPGQSVMMTGHLSPPQGPVEPGGFDFRRLAWFQTLGGVGYTRNPALLISEPEILGLRLALYDLRLRLSAAITSRITGPEGGFAAAIVTGDRAGLDPERVEDLRHSNLAHLLAISGLHMGLLTGAVFFALRAALAAIPRLAPRYGIKKIAALGALIAALVYLHISGASVATERAFIMAAIMLTAICLDRRAISIRAVAIAAMIVLILRPESVVSAGFQMSFAATTALVAVFTALRAEHWDYIPRWARGPASVALSSLIAGLATAPFAAAHFNIFSQYGLIANLAAVPVMGLIVMPGALLALILAPVSGEGIGLWAMEQGIAWILFVADTIANLDGAVRPIAAPQAYVLPMIVAGGLLMLLDPRRTRLLGTIPILAALLVWSQVERPLLLISQSGGLIGVLTPEGRVLSKERGESFAAENWLENDGDTRAQSEAFAASGFVHTRARTDLPQAFAGLSLIQLRSKYAAQQIPDLCARNTVIISTQRIEAPVADCVLLSADHLRDTGSIALHLVGGTWHIQASADVAGDRLWSRTQKTGPFSGPLFAVSQRVASDQ